MRRGRMLAFFAIAVAIFSLGSGVYLALAPLPGPDVIRIVLPEKYEILPAKMVSPGTFRIDVDLYRFLDEAKASNKSAIVVYGFSVGRFISLQYWLVRDDGLLYHTVQNFSPKWSRNFVIDHIELTDNDRLTIYPTRDGSLIAINFLVSIVSLLLGTMGLGGMDFVSGARAPKNQPTA